MKNNPLSVVEIVCEGEIILAQVMLDDFAKNHALGHYVLFTDVDPSCLEFPKENMFKGVVKFIKPISSVEVRCIIYLLHFVVRDCLKPKWLTIYDDDWQDVDIESIAPKQLLNFLDKLSASTLSWCFPAENAYQNFCELNVQTLLINSGDVGYKFRQCYSTMLDDILSMQSLIWCPARLGKKDNYKRTGESIVKFLRPIRDAKKSRMNMLGFRKLKDVIDFFFDGASIGRSKKVNYSSNVWPYAMVIMSCWFFRASLVYKERGLFCEAVMSVTRAVEFCLLAQGMRDGLISLTPGEGRVVVNNKEVVGIGGVVHELLKYGAIGSDQKLINEIWALLSLRNNSKLTHGVLDIEKELFDDSYTTGMRFSKELYDENFLFLSDKVSRELGESPLLNSVKEGLRKEVLDVFTSEI